jgi:hypothetical protein
MPISNCHSVRGFTRTDGPPENPCYCFSARTAALRWAVGSEEPYESYTSAPRLVAMHVSSAYSVVTHSRAWLPGSSHG